MRTAASLVLIPLVALGVRSCTDVEVPSPDRLSPNTAQGQVQLDVFTDFPTFEATPGRLVEIDFEDQPIDGSSRCSPDLDPFCTPIPNPLVLEGTTFIDPHDLRTGFCSSPTCKADPDNPDGGNITLVLNPGGTIDFPPRTPGAMLIIEGIGENPFQVRVTDSGGNTKTIDGKGVYFGLAFLGFRSPRGISRAEVLGVGGTGGPLVLSAVFLKVHDGGRVAFPSPRHRQRRFRVQVPPVVSER